MNHLKVFWLLMVVSAILIIGGCGQSLLRQGEQALNKPDYEEALSYLRQALQERPNDPAVQKALGQVYYHLEDYEQSERFLKAASFSLPKDPTVILYLGMLAEFENDFIAAVEMYEKFLAVNPKSKFAPQVRGRLLYVRNERLRQDVAQSIKDEEQLALAEPAEKTVGVLPFAFPTGANENLRSLAHGMAASLWYDLSSVKELQVVERLQLKYLTDELSATEKGFVPKESGPRLGRLVKAKHLVRASLDTPAPERLSAESGLINTTSKAYSPSLSVDEALSKALKVQKEMTLAVLDTLGVKVKGAERRALKKLPTESFESFLAFGRGVESFDQGEYGKASSFFAEAVRLDPSFELAGDFRDDARQIEEGGVDLGRFATTVAASIAGEKTSGVSAKDDLWNLMNAAEDPRNEDLPATTTGTGSATVHGTIR